MGMMGDASSLELVVEASLLGPTGASLLEVPPHAKGEGKKVPLGGTGTGKKGPNIELRIETATEGPINGTVGYGSDSPLAGRAMDGPLAGISMNGRLAGTTADGPLAGSGMDGPLLGTTVNVPLAGITIEGPLAGTAMLPTIIHLVLEGAKLAGRWALHLHVGIGPRGADPQGLGAKGPLTLPSEGEGSTLSS